MMSKKRILPSIGLEGTKEELLEFLSDFEINKIAISFVGDRMVLTTSVPVDINLMDIFEQAYGISNENKLDLNLVESSFDLLTNPKFTVTKRKDWMISTPFVLNNAIIIRQKIKPTPVLEDNPKPQLYRRNVASRDSLSVRNDSLR